MKPRSVVISQRVVTAVWTAGALFALALLAYAVASRTRAASQLPASRNQLAIELTRAPANWQLARDITARALDEGVTHRIALWRAAYRMLAARNPQWGPARVDFVKAGLFHWNELSAGDRRDILEAAGHLLADEDSFFSYYRPLWEVTRDMDFLRAHRPRSVRATRALLDIAARNGEFDDYRALRDELTNEHRFEFARRVAGRASAEQFLIEAVAIDKHARNDAVLEMYLERLGEFPPNRLHVMPNALAETVDYAIRHQLPYEAFFSFVDDESLPLPLRARIALANGEKVRADRIEQTAGSTRTAEWTAYHVDRIYADLRDGRVEDAAARFGRIAAQDQKHARVLAAREALERVSRDAAGLAAVRSELSVLYDPSTLDPRRWSRLCGGALCTEASAFAWVSEAVDAPLRVASTSADRVAPYLELYDNDRLVFEGALEPQQTIAVRLQTPGLHELRARLVNSRTRNLEPRSITILSPQ